MTVSDAYDYIPSGSSSPNDPTAIQLPHGGGNNPSTWAGILVIVAIVGLGVTRKTFRRFM